MKIKYVKEHIMVVLWFALVGATVLSGYLCKLCGVGEAIPADTMGTVVTALVFASLASSLITAVFVSHIAEVNRMHDRVELTFRLLQTLPPLVKDDLPAAQEATDAPAEDNSVITPPGAAECVAYTDARKEVKEEQPQIHTDAELSTEERVIRV